jgi:DNA-binding NarL/FixJ family response regulator
MNRPRILIVDDHRVVAEGLVRFLSDRFDIVDTIADGRLVLEAVGRTLPDLVLLDLSMPNVSGLEVLRRLGEQNLGCKVIVLTMHADPNIAVAALKAGASAFVLKESSGGELIAALQMVLAGGVYLSPNVTKEVLTLMVGAADPARVELSPQQREVLRLLISGQRTKEIAATLEMSTHGVETIKRKTMQLLNVHSTSELVRYAVEHRLVPF